MFRPGHSAYVANINRPCTVQAYNIVSTSTSGETYFIVAHIKKAWYLKGKGT